jgi:hypothetical protein
MATTWAFVRNLLIAFVIGVLAGGTTVGILWNGSYRQLDGELAAGRADAAEIRDLNTQLTAANQGLTGDVAVLTGQLGDAAATNQGLTRRLGEASATVAALNDHLKQTQDRLGGARAIIDQISSTSGTALDAVRQVIANLKLLKEILGTNPKGGDSGGISGSSSNSGSSIGGGISPQVNFLLEGSPGQVP